MLHDSIEDRGNSYESAFTVEPRSGREGLQRLARQLAATVQAIARHRPDAAAAP